MPSAAGDAQNSATVEALRKLSIFTADQAGAYREHFADLAVALGPDIETRLGQFVSGWARDNQPGVVILTGNAGTGKTAVAETYARAVGGVLPTRDGLEEVRPGHWVIKDLSGIPSPDERSDALLHSLTLSRAQILICANEGVLRDALLRLEDKETTAILDRALRSGAAADGLITIVNVNRQRPTSDSLWDRILEYVTAEEKWSGCSDCPFAAGGCPMRSNAGELRRVDVREQLRSIVRVASGDSVPSLREVLAILAWAIVGPQSCTSVKNAVRDRGASAFTAAEGYFGRLLGSGLPASVAERSPLLSSMTQSGLGDVSDLQVDGWLRDASGAPEGVRRIAGDPSVTNSEASDQGRSGGLAGSLSPLDRVRTAQGEMTFYALGEMVSTDEDITRVEDGLNALVRGDGVSNVPAEQSWRQRVYFEGSEALGGHSNSTRRMLKYRHIVELVELAQTAAHGGDVVLTMNELVKGLNFLVTGFSSPNEGLIVPDPACLFARDPGSFRPARPSLVRSQVPLNRLSIEVPDTGLVQTILDIDHVDVILIVDKRDDLSLRITPRMYEAIREAAEFEGPVGQGVAEMNDLRAFYGRLASSLEPDSRLRVADPDSAPPAIVTVNLPHFQRTSN